MAEYFETQDKAETFIAKTSRKPTFFGRVTTDFGEKWIVELTGRDPYQHFSHVEDHSGRIKLIRAIQEPTDINLAFTGGLGEHYCSQKCYDAGGATITKHFLQNYTGDCSVCRRPIRLGVTDLASMVCWKPGLFLFHCGSSSCIDAVRKHIRETHICAVCGAPVSAAKKQVTFDDFKDCPICKAKVKSSNFERHKTQCEMRQRMPHEGHEEARKSRETRRQEKQERYEKGRKALEQAEQQRRCRVQAMRKISRQCVMCGHPLNFINRLFAKDRHLGCRTFKE